MDPAHAWRRPAPFLFGVAFLHRLLLAVWTTTIASDGAAYLGMAEAFAGGRASHALAGFRGVHPLYPLLVAALGASETAAYAVAVLAGAAAVVPLYFLVRAWWSERVAFWSGLLYALHPILTFEGSEVMTTSLFLGLFVTSVALIVFAFEKRSWLLFLLAGAASGLCYLTRPEGVLLLPIFCGAALARRFGFFQPAPPANLKQYAVGATAFLAALVLVASPYLLWIHAHTGKWSITLRPSAGAVAPGLGGEAPMHSAPPEETAPRKRSFVDTARRFPGALYWGLVPFLAIGLAFTPRAGGRWRTLAVPAAVALLTLAPPFLLYFATGGHYAVSRRYFLTSSIFLLPWCAAGLLLAADALKRPWASRALLAVVLAAMVLKDLGPRRAEEAPFVEAGRWLKSQPGTGAVLSSRDKLAYYAGARGVILPPSEASAEAYAARLAAFGRANGASHLLLDDGSLRELPPGLPDALAAASFRIERRFPELPEKKLNAVWVYRLP